MDSMDWTRDSPPPPPSAPCQYMQNQQQLPQLHTSFRQRENPRHYDPVHNAWFQQPVSPSQAPLSGLQQFWSSTFVPNPWSMSPTSDAQQAARQAYSEFEGLPSIWSSQQMYAPVAPSYLPASSSSSANTTPVEPSSAASAPPRMTLSSDVARHSSSSRLPRADSRPPPDIETRARHFSQRLQQTGQSHQRLAHPSSRGVATHASLPRSNSDSFTSLPRSNSDSFTERFLAMSSRLDELDDDERSTSEVDLDDHALQSMGFVNQSYNEDERQRMLAFARGRVAAASKRVPTKETIASFEKPDLRDIPMADRNCMICYNEFGVTNPEGIKEAPLRLPKCKHLFGEQCLQKWFEDNDSCPYCRDKLQSTLRIPNSTLADIMRPGRQRHMTSSRTRPSFMGQTSAEEELASPQSQSDPLHAFYERLQEASRGVVDYSHLSAATESHNGSPEHRRHWGRRSATFDRRWSGLELGHPASMVAQTSAAPIVPRRSDPADVHPAFTTRSLALPALGSDSPDRRTAHLPRPGNLESPSRREGLSPLANSYSAVGSSTLPRTRPPTTGTWNASWSGDQRRSWGPSHATGQRSQMADPVASVERALNQHETTGDRQARPINHA